MPKHTKRGPILLSDLIGLIETRGTEAAHTLLGNVARSRLRLLLQEATESGLAVPVRVLVKALGPGKECTDALKKAAEAGHLDVVRSLIPFSNARADDSEALCHAARRGHLDVVQALIPVSEPKAHSSHALLVATQLGHTEVVRALTPVSDPTAMGSKAFLCATGDWSWDLAELLLPFPHSNTALTEALHDTQLAREMGANATEREQFQLRLLRACPQEVIDDTCTLLFEHGRLGAGATELIEWVSLAFLRNTDTTPLVGAPALMARWQARILETELTQAPQGRERLRL